MSGITKHGCTQNYIYILAIQTISWSKYTREPLGWVHITTSSYNPEFETEKNKQEKISNLKKTCSDFFPFTRCLQLPCLYSEEFVALKKPIIYTYQQWV